MAHKKITQILYDFRPGFPVLIWKVALWLIALSALAIPGAIHMGWIRIPTIPFLNGMAAQPKAKPQSVTPWFPNGISARKPVPGTIPQNVVAYPFPNDPEKAGAFLANPLPPTPQNMRRGELLFDHFCQPCHGFKAQGDGSATGAGRVPPPPTLHSDKVRNWPDGRIYHVLTMGQNKMPSYAKQVEPVDRWAVVLFVRVLQRSQAPKPGDLPSTSTTTAAFGASGGKP